MGELFSHQCPAHGPRQLGDYLLVKSCAPAAGGIRSVSVDIASVRYQVECPAYVSDLDQAEPVFQHYPVIL